MPTRSVVSVVGTFSRVACAPTRQVFRHEGKDGCHCSAKGAARPSQGPRFAHLVPKPTPCRAKNDNGPIRRSSRKLLISLNRLEQRWEPGNESLWAPASTEPSSLFVMRRAPTREA